MPIRLNNTAPCPPDDFYLKIPLMHPVYGQDFFYYSQEVID